MLLLLIPAAHAEGKCRALLIGEQTYVQESYADRPGARNSAQGMSEALIAMNIGYETKVLTDAPAADVLTAIAAVGADADAGDTTLFYLNCHGVSTSGVCRMLLAEESELTAQDLFNALNAVPGRVIVLLDACGSGGALDTRGDGAEGAFADAFSMGAEAGLFDSSRFSVICSSGVEQNSYRLSFDGGTTDASIGTVLSFSFCEGIGWDYVDKRTTARRADFDFDGVITLDDMATFLSARVNYRLKGTGYTQTVIVYPEGDGTVLFDCSK